jgi:hypothetical protein
MEEKNHAYQKTNDGKWKELESKFKEQGIGSLFWWRYGNGYFTIRLFGHGFNIKNWTLNGLTFSERNCIATNKPIWIFGRYIVKRLRPQK